MPSDGCNIRLTLYILMTARTSATDVQKRPYSRSYSSSSNRFNFNADKIPRVIQVARLNSGKCLLLSVFFLKVFLVFLFSQLMVFISIHPKSNASGLDFWENTTPVRNEGNHYSTELFTKKAQSLIKHHDPAKVLVQKYNRTR